MMKSIDLAVSSRDCKDKVLANALYMASLVMASPSSPCCDGVRVHHLQADWNLIREAMVEFVESYETEHLKRNG